jgi:hypothetical protein
MGEGVRGGGGGELPCFFLKCFASPSLDDLSPSGMYKGISGTIGIYISLIYECYAMPSFFECNGYLVVPIILAQKSNGYLVVRYTFVVFLLGPPPSDGHRLVILVFFRFVPNDWSFFFFDSVQ